MVNFTQNPLVLVCIFFILSLIGAIILFKCLHSHATIKSEKWQAGGAIGGFIIIFLLCFFVYTWIKRYEEKIDTLEVNLNSKQSEIDRLNKVLETKLIEGIIKPYKEHTIIFLAVEACVPRSVDGKFRLRTSCIDPEYNDISLHIITEKGHTQYNIYSEEEMSGIEIPMEE